ncbi:MAG: hypothetical protein WAN46_18515 [Gammaproteobacteria bacterium]|jgi:hypothetical protein
MSFGRRPIWWVLGVAVALTGVAIARILGPQLPPAYQSSVFVAGAAIAVLGVFVAALGAGHERSSKAPDA